MSADGTYRLSATIAARKRPKEGKQTGLSVGNAVSISALCQLSLGVLKLSPTLGMHQVQTHACGLADRLGADIEAHTAYNTRQVTLAFSLANSGIVTARQYRLRFTPAS